MNISKMRFEQGYAVASVSEDIRSHPKDPVYLNCRASEAQSACTVIYWILVHTLICLLTGISGD